MHVLFLGKFFWASAERRGMPSVYKCLKGFEEAGHRVTAIFPTNDRSLPRSFDYDGMRLHLVRIPLIPYTRKFSHLNSLNSVTFRLPMLSKLWSACFYCLFVTLAFIRAVRICLKDRVDLVYGLMPVGAMAAWLVARFFRKPVIFRFFGTRVCPFEKLEWRWLGFPYDLVGFWLPCDAMVMTNDGTFGDKAALGLGVAPEKLFFWINGVDKDHLVKPDDLARFRSELGFDATQRLVVIVSRLADWKRVDRAIRAFARVAERFEDVHLVSVGAGNMRDELEELARKTGFAERIKFMGLVPRTELPSYYYLGDVFLYTGSLSSLSNCVMEAMVCGLPIVVTDAGGIREICHDGENSLVVPEEDIDAIAAGVIELLSDDEKRKRLGENARRFAETQLDTWDERVKREVEMAEELTRRFRLHVRPRSPKFPLPPDVTRRQVYR